MNTAGKGVTRAASSVVPEISPTQRRPRSHTESMWNIRPGPVLSPTPNSSSSQSGTNSLKKRAAPRPPPTSTSRGHLDHYRRKSAAPGGASGGGGKSDGGAGSKHGMSGARLVLPSGGEMPHLKPTGSSVLSGSIMPGGASGGMVNGQSIESLNSVLSSDDNPQPPPRKVSSSTLT
jgi:hypothetical protein